ncbi:hypothetical protein ACHHYP_10648 [Achlya hypogyna]|uniref:Uncharacterized protein n=1 Tax=Achlya hypogyna TaxID=1202772 RepID=A0A1V9YKU3_ACHHY|nr:hypothetical protein ACHHYP_10648 [Achlya hypogyna]
MTNLCERVHDVVFAYLGPLTQLLNGWQEAFRRDWPGDLALLPSVNLDTSSYRLIRSRSMYARVCCGLSTDAAGVDAPHLAAAVENVWLDELTPQLLDPPALARAAVFGGHVALLEHLVMSAGIDPTALGELNESYSRLAMDAVALAGHLHMLQWLHRAGSNETVLDWAICTWLVAHLGFRPSPYAMNIALRAGHINIVDYFLRDCGVDLPGSALELAAISGNLALVRCLHEEWGHNCTGAALESAAIYGHLPVVEYLHQRTIEPCTTNAMDGAACKGHLDTLRFLHEHRTEGCTPFALDSAFRNNHMDIVVFLHQHRTEGGTTKAIDSAARRGHEAIVRFLHEHRSEGCTTRAVDWAASNGRLSIVQYLTTHRPAGFTFRAFFWAAANGHFDILACLLSVVGGQRLAAQAVERALSFRYRKAFVALQAAGCPNTQDVDVDGIEWSSYFNPVDLLDDDVLENGEDEYLDSDSNYSIDDY